MSFFQRERDNARFKRWHDQNRDHVREYKAAYYLKRRDEILKRAKDYAAKNPEAVAKNKKRYEQRHGARLKEEKARWRAENAAAILAYNKAWRAANADLIKAKSKKYQREKPDVHRSTARNRRARESGAPGAHSAADIAKINQAQGRRCIYCEADTTHAYRVDHIVPLARGGTNWPSNLQITCPTCNRRKHTMTHEEFARRRAKARPE